MAELECEDLPFFDVKTVPDEIKKELKKYTLDGGFITELIWGFMPIKVCHFKGLGQQRIDSQFY